MKFIKIWECIKIVNILTESSLASGQIQFLLSECGTKGGFKSEDTEESMPQ
jgi:hypothetical protein